MVVFFSDDQIDEVIEIAESTDSKVYGHSPTEDLDNLIEDNGSVVFVHESWAKSIAGLTLSESKAAFAISKKELY